MRCETAAARVCAAALTVLGLTALVADRHPPIDRRIFSVLNHHRDEPGILRVIQQFGTPWVLPGIAVAAALTGHRRLAVAATLGLPAEKTLEVGLKKLRPTPRPLYVEPTVLRDDAPVEGESFPSGHAAIAWAAVTLVAPYVPRYASGVLAGCATASSAVRVSQGAHHPIDAIGGAALGVATGAALTWAVMRTSRDQTRGSRPTW